MKRLFFPGDEWIYYNIYISPIHADHFLETIKNTCLNNLLDNELIDKWFFIRYVDRFYHVRLRIHVKSNDPIVYYETLSIVNKCIMNLSDLYSIWNITIGTYKREIERYHESLIEDCETFFFLDSCNTVDILSNFKNLDVWQIAFAKIDILLKTTMATSDAQCFLQTMSKSFLSEFNHINNHKDLDKMYRNKKPLLFHLTENLCSSHNEIYKWKEVLSSDSIHSFLCMAHNINVLDSLIHMIVNRIIPNEPRIYEMIIYFFLEKYYKSLTFIQKQT